MRLVTCADAILPLVLALMLLSTGKRFKSEWHNYLMQFSNPSKQVGLGAKGRTVVQ